MGTMHAPERRPAEALAGSENVGNVDLSHATRAHVRIGATAEQCELARAATCYRREHGRWPTARELALYADVGAPTVWAALKVLGRLGVVAWGRRVEVLRQPDGVVWAVGGEA
jgi:hypothetical protein